MARTSLMETWASEDKDTLGSILDRVEQGEEIVITRDGRRVAKLVPTEPVRDVAAAMAAAERILQRKKEHSGPPITIEEILSFRDEGRR
jgi:prevent-host-death family protein